MNEEDKHGNPIVHKLHTDRDFLVHKRSENSRKVFTNIYLQQQNHIPLQCAECLLENQKGYDIIHSFMPAAAFFTKPAFSVVLPRI